MEHNVNVVIKVEVWASKMKHFDVYVLQSVTDFVAANTSKAAVTFLCSSELLSNHHSFQLL